MNRYGLLTLLFVCGILIGLMLGIAVRYMNAPFRPGKSQRATDCREARFCRTSALVSPNAPPLLTRRSLQQVNT